ncbi:MAG: YjjG family noncanonical pyrimidine nucleotidase [Oscillospiraceae bacterium]|jgi:putative hydrolase of the HAD superfamily|nr:YjjG family noncanonical pyrimidine nucleotidase [Oscillospiraceae bacterium]
MEKIKSIFFDADGTIINNKECEKQALIYLFENIGISYKEEFQNIFRPIDTMLWENESYNGISVTRDEIPVYRFQLLFEKLDISYDNYQKANDLFKIGLTNSKALMENSEEIVEYLYNKNYILCVVTNGLIEIQKPKVINSKIGKFFTHIIVSEEVGAHKPNPLIFNTLLERLCLSPCDVIMIGDSLKNDIQGAKNVNIKNIWYNPEKNQNNTNIIPDIEINDLIQLKDMF